MVFTRFLLVFYNCDNEIKQGENLDKQIFAQENSISSKCSINLWEHSETNPNDMRPSFQSPCFIQIEA
ncbi:hypothetical protein BpHYR1_024308 [Brachionus plicatilis]|uniref:Uncharacterized protein n=1 Tax=Brachionus plicatilis TaxID=10195 RepID=A0A3M7SDW4_BRAPC|nr:hypothetical protein BpHYR1_024308 [Brachionus plicatilis]